MRPRFHALIAWGSSPAGYVKLAWAALIANVVIVFTGAAVRLTGSGLGCPDWPRCYENGPVYADLQTHDVIEFTNRFLTTFVSIAAISALVFAWLRRRERPDLLRPAALVAGGVFFQAVLGGITVRYHLAYETVMAHYMVSMVLIVAAVVLVWRATHERADHAAAGERDRFAIRWTRALLALGAVVVFAGTAATAAGPHAGGSGTGDEVGRLVLDRYGSGTVDWVIHRHGNIAMLLGIATVALFLVLRRRGADATVQRALTAVGLTIAAQGVVGISQYHLELPAEVVWVHVVLAVATWLALAFAAVAAATPGPAAAAVAGAIPSRARVHAPDPPASRTGRDLVA